MSVAYLLSVDRVNGSTGSVIAQGLNPFLLAAPLSPLFHPQIHGAHDDHVFVNDFTHRFSLSILCSMNVMKLHLSVLKLCYNYRVIWPALLT